MGDERMRGNRYSHKLNSMDYEALMHLAIEEAKESGNDVPVGAILLDPEGKVVARGHNRKEANNDPTAHAEIEVLREACAIQGDWRLRGYSLIVTLEPCLMCAGAIRAARIQRVIYGATESNSGAGGSAYDVLRDRRLGGSLCEVYSEVLSRECEALITDHFRIRRSG